MAELGTHFINRKSDAGNPQPRGDPRQRSTRFAVSCGGLRPVAITGATRSATAKAIAWPMPWPAPVTRATRPSWVFVEVLIDRLSAFAGRL
jgi:hypothetical protein